MKNLPIIRADRIILEKVDQYRIGHRDETKGKQLKQMERDAIVSILGRFAIVVDRDEVPIAKYQEEEYHTFNLELFRENHPKLAEVYTDLKPREIFKLL